MEIYNNISTLKNYSTDNILQKKEVSDSEDKGTNKERKIRLHELLTDIYITFDPDDKTSVDRALDQINNTKESVKNREITKINEIEVNEEIFNYELHGNNILITHPVWSLTGFGENLFQAIKDLHENMREVKEDYIYDFDSQLTDDAIELKSFLLNSI